MAQIYWLNSSTQNIKWMAFVNGGWQGNLLTPQQSNNMDDAGVSASGWSFSGFTGITYSLLPVNTPPGYSAYQVAVDSVNETEDPLSNLKEPTTE